MLFALMSGESLDISGLLSVFWLTPAAKFRARSSSHLFPKRGP